MKRTFIAWIKHREEMRILRKQLTDAPKLYMPMPKLKMNIINEQYEFTKAVWPHPLNHRPSGGK